MTVARSTTFASPLGEVPSEFREELRASEVGLLGLGSAGEDLLVESSCDTVQTFLVAVVTRGLPEEAVVLVQNLLLLVTDGVLVEDVEVCCSVDGALEALLRDELQQLSSSLLNDCEVGVLVVMELEYEYGE